MNGLIRVDDRPTREGAGADGLGIAETHSSLNSAPMG
jgi:hypothetical protein